MAMGFGDISNIMTGPWGQMLTGLLTAGNDAKAQEQYTEDLQSILEAYQGRAAGGLKGLEGRGTQQWNYATALADMLSGKAGTLGDLTSAGYRERYAGLMDYLDPKIAELERGWKGLAGQGGGAPTDAASQYWAQTGGGWKEGMGFADGRGGVVEGYAERTEDLGGRYGERTAALTKGYEGRTSVIDEMLAKLGKEVTGGYEERHEQGMGYLEGMGGQALEDVSQRWREREASSTADLTSRGLSASTIGPTLGQGFEREKGAELRRLEDQLREQKLRWDTGLSGEALQARERLGTGRAGMQAALSGEALSAQGQAGGQELAALLGMTGEELAAKERVPAQSLAARERLLGTRMGYETGLLGDWLSAQERGGERALGYDASLYGGLADLMGQQSRDWFNAYGGLTGDVLGFWQNALQRPQSSQQQLFQFGAGSQGGPEVPGSSGSDWIGPGLSGAGSILSVFPPTSWLGLGMTALGSGITASKR